MYVFRQSCTRWLSYLIFVKAQSKHSNTMYSWINGTITEIIMTDHRPKPTAIFKRWRTHTYTRNTYRDRGKSFVIPLAVKVLSQKIELSSVYYYASIFFMFSFSCLLFYLFSLSHKLGIGTVIIIDANRKCLGCIIRILHVLDTVVEVQYIQSLITRVYKYIYIVIEYWFCCCPVILRHQN